VCDGWATIANTAPPDVRMYFVGRTTANKARVYGVRDDRVDGAVRLQGYPVTRALDGMPPVLKDIGMVVANPCNDFGCAQPITYVLTRTAGSGTNRPSVVRAHDRSADQLDAIAYFCRKMPSTADELSSSPTYSDQGGTTYLYFVTESGWLWTINPFQPLVLPHPFPVQLSSTVSRHDMAMDADGAIIVVTNDGRVRATWGPR